MAVELKAFLSHLLEQDDVNIKDKPFIGAIRALVEAYLGSGSPRSREIYSGQQESGKETGQDLSKIPYDVDAVDNTQLVGFISRLDVPFRVKSALVRHIAFIPFEERDSYWEKMKLETIRNLYRLSDDGQIYYLRQIGEKSMAVIKKSLKSVSETGVMPLGEDINSILIYRRLMKEHRYITENLINHPKKLVLPA